MTNNDIQLRTIEPASLPEICQLWNEAALWDPCCSQVLQEKIFSDPAVLPALCVAAFLNDEVVGIGVAALHDARGFIKLIAVPPKQQQTGIGTSLVRALEDVLGQAGAVSVRLGESAPNYLTPGIDQRNAAAITFFQQLGYRSIGTAYNQLVDLSASDWDTSLAERELAELHGIAVDRAATQDRPQIEALLQSEWPSWQGEAFRALSNDPPTIHLAKRNDSVVAFAVHDANNLGTGWFGPMGTLPDYNGRGIGRILLWRCLADMKLAGRSEATIPWVGPLGFYEQHAGARLSRQFERMEKTL